MSLLDYFKKNKSHNSEDSFSMRFDDPGFGNVDKADTPVSATKKIRTFSDLPQSEFIFKDPGVNDYAERWGAASVNSVRYFLIGMIAVCTAAYSTHYAIKVSTEQKAERILVEFNGVTGEYKKPVKLDVLTATDAMVKFGLGRWAEWVFTIDPKLSYNYLQDADAMAKGRARDQFGDYRYTTEIIRHIKENKRLVFAKALAVDILTPGVVVVHLETKELDGNGALMESTNYRVRLDYTINPPTEAAVVLRNPIGLEVNGFTYERLAK